MADIVWRTTRLPDCIINAPYEASLAVTGNATAFTAATPSPALPAGLAISADFVRITGTYTGTPTVWTGTISLTDTAGAVSSGTLSINCRYAGESDLAVLGQSQLNQYENASLGRLWPLTF